MVKPTIGGALNRTREWRAQKKPVLLPRGAAIQAFHSFSLLAREDRANVSLLYLSWRG
jgi:hypothetical protein